MKSKFGCTRHVFLTKKYAIKIPQFRYEWKHFLQGLLANMQEVTFYTTKDERLCPILFYIPGGWMVVMPKCHPINREEFFNMDMKRFYPHENNESNSKVVEDWDVPVENKEDSFGWYEDRIVALDYGN